MNSRNLGVVFGRKLLIAVTFLFAQPLQCLATLMRSRDPGSEFGDMAGKALSVEWLVDNAPQVFNVKI